MAKRLGVENRAFAHMVIAGCSTILIAILFTYLIYGEVMKAPDNQPDLNQVQYLSNWVADIDGEEVPVTIPDSKDMTGHDNVTIKTHIGDVPAEYDTLLVWSKGQKVEAYCNGELFYVYDPDSADSFGANSTYIYVFMDLPDNISNSEIALKYSAVLENDAGKIGDVLIGRRAPCLIQVVKANQLELFLGLFVILIGLVELILSIALHLFTKRDVALFYQAGAVVTLGFWVVSNSRARQFIYPNASIIRDCAFLVLPLIAICFSVYVDIIQKERYHNMYMIIVIASIVDFLVISGLNYSNILAFSESRMGSLVVLGITVLTIVVTMVYDIFKRKDKSYILVAIGLLSLAICGIIQLVMESTLKLSVISGTAISLGLIILVVFGLLFTVKQISQLDSDRIKAIDKVEYLSRTSMEALAKTVDAKDRYTSGHSIRVAEVSCTLAKELGWNDDEILDLRFQGMMHDIGKIGVPDTVLNKPGRLTNIEFELIQSHTVVGSEILKNVTSIPEVENVARHHHERYDGHGYPDHLKGEEIPISARIVGIADAYDAMNSDRVYRKALPKKVIREEIIKGKGSQFDPELVDVFIKLFDEDKLDVKEDTESYIKRKDDAFDSTDFSAEVNKEINSILEDYDVTDIERVKLGEIVRFLRRLRDEYYKYFQVIVFSVRPIDEDLVNEEYMVKSVESMELAIKKSVRDKDISVRYSKTQFMVVLFDANPDNIGLVVQRILLDFYKLFDASVLDISYKVVDLDEDYNTGITKVEEA